MGSYRINIRDLVLAELTKDDKTGAIYVAKEEMDKIPGSMQIQISPKLSSGSLYGDGKKVDEQNNLASYEITYDNNKIPYSIIAKYTGKKLVGNTVVANAGDVPKYFAMGYVVDLHDGNTEVSWIYKCKFAPGDRDMQQKTDNVNYSTDSFKISSVPLAYNGDLDITGDTSDDKMGFTKAMAEEFFNEVAVHPPGAVETPQSGE